MRSMIPLLFVLALGSTASADEPQADPPPSPYAETIVRALQEFSLEHWIEAKVLFSRANALQPNARALRGLGLACYESRQYVEAIGHLEQALAHPAQPLTPEMKRDVEVFLDQARQFVSRVELELEPQHAEVALDGGAALQLPADGTFLLDPGAHEVVASAAGFVSETRRVVAEGGNALKLKLTLVPLRSAHEAVAVPSAAIRSEPAEARASRAEPAAPRGLGAGLLIGAASAVTLAGGVLLAVAAVNKARVENPDDHPSWDDYDGLYDTSKVLFPVSEIMLGVGLAGLATGIAWQLWPSPAESQPTALIIQPAYARLVGCF